MPLVTQVLLQLATLPLPVLMQLAPVSHLQVFPAYDALRSTFLASVPDSLE